MQLPDSDETHDAVDADPGPDAGLGFYREHRLHAPAEFSLVFAARRVFRGKCFDLHYAARPVSPVAATGETGARIGLVIAKKFVRRSVQRNLLKRLAREAFRHVRSDLPSYDLVLRLARPPVGNLKAEGRQACREDIGQLLARVAQLPRPQ